MEKIKPLHTFKFNFIADRKESILAIKSAYGCPSLGAAKEMLENLTFTTHNFAPFSKYWERLGFWDKSRFEELEKKKIIEIIKTPIPLSEKDIKHNEAVDLHTQQYNAAMEWYNNLNPTEKAHCDIIILENQKIMVASG